MQVNGDKWAVDYKGNKALHNRQFWSDWGLLWEKAELNRLVPELLQCRDQRMQHWSAYIRRERDLLLMTEHSTSETELQIDLLLNGAWRWVDLLP